MVPRRRWVRVFSVPPRPVRDWLYDRVARNRYRLFGRTETCMVPTPELMRRFVLEESGATTERAGR
jgi:predicted DCC family thiol-disulfide oxidoreductase YuxK